MANLSLGWLRSRVLRGDTDGLCRLCHRVCTPTWLKRKVMISATYFQALRFKECVHTRKRGEGGKESDRRQGLRSFQVPMFSWVRSSGPVTVRAH